MRWWEHIKRMEEDLYIPGTGGERKRGQKRKNWIDTMYKDLQDFEMTWEEAEEAAKDKTI